MRPFPSGPRWFLGLQVGNDAVCLRLIEGTTEDAHQLIPTQGSPMAKLVSSDIVYVFGEYVSEDELVATVAAMFSAHGPGITEKYAAQIESIVRPWRPTWKYDERPA